MHQNDLEQLPVWKAERTVTPVVTIVLVSPETVPTLIKLQVLERKGKEELYVHPMCNKNPSQVNLGDLLRVDDVADIYPMKPEYFRGNFTVISGDTTFNQK